MTGPVRISQEQIDADQRRALEQALWWLNRPIDLTDRLAGALDVVNNHGPWLDWCRRLVSYRRVIALVEDLKAKAAADRRAKRVTEPAPDLTWMGEQTDE